jgi:hypothetical protein
MPTGSYNYGITRTATHCPGLPGTCGTPAAGQVVFYRWPVNVEGTARYARLSAIEQAAQFLTLPFSDTAVKRHGIWRYGDGNWHHAGDYGRGDETFRILACAAGRVIHVGWDNWSGNTVIVSHDVDGVQDAYRTIYMHLRNERLQCGLVADGADALRSRAIAVHPAPERDRLPAESAAQPGSRALGDRCPDHSCHARPVGRARCRSRLVREHRARRQARPRRSQHSSAHLLRAP